MRYIKLISVVVIALVVFPAISTADYSGVYLHIAKIDLFRMKAFMSAIDSRYSEALPANLLQQREPLSISAQIEKIARSQKGVRRAV